MKGHVHWGFGKRKSLKDGVGTRKDGVVKNESVQPGQGCTLIFQAATNLVAVLYFPATEHEFTTGTWIQRPILHDLHRLVIVVHGSTRLVFGTKTAQPGLAVTLRHLVHTCAPCQFGTSP